MLVSVFEPHKHPAPAGGWSGYPDEMVFAMMGHAIPLRDAILLMFSYYNSTQHMIAVSYVLMASHHGDYLLVSTVE